MKKNFYFFIIVLFILQNLSASCDGDQININEASSEELDKLYGIGPSRAQAIIDSRPFESVEDLIDVIGIGNKTLEGIKNQGIACVETNNKKENEEKNKKEVSKEVEIEKIKETVRERNLLADSLEEKPLETIKLSPQNIKTDKNFTYEQGKTFYMTFGFCLLLAFLFFLKIRRNKNEFR